MTAKEGLTFNVAGKGSVKFQTNINGERRTITFNNMLYTPGFRSNLILLSKLSTKGVEVSFKENKAVIKTENGTDIIMTTQTKQLYVVDINNILPFALTT